MHIELLLGGKPGWLRALVNHLTFKAVKVHGQQNSAWLKLKF